MLNIKKTKILSIFSLIFITSTLAFATTNCANEKNYVKLMNIKPDQIGFDHQFDYYLCAQPVTYMKKTKFAGLTEVAKISDLYNEFCEINQGLCQAVLLVKDNIFYNEYEFLNSLQTSLVNDALFCVNNPLITIQNLRSFYDPGYAPIFNELNAKKEIFAECGLNFFRPQDLDNLRNWINQYLVLSNNISSEIQILSDDQLKKFIPDNKLFANHNFKPNNVKHKLLCPDGAPSLFLSNIKNELIDYQELLDCKIVESTQLMSKLYSNNYDIAILPLNMAVKLFINDPSWCCYASLTNGNLSLLSYNSTNLDKQNINNLLINKTIGVINLWNIPGISLKVILKLSGINYYDVI